jgi:hypothetical protein
MSGENTANRPTKQLPSTDECIRQSNRQLSRESDRVADNVASSLQSRQELIGRATDHLIFLSTEGDEETD